MFETGRQLRKFRKGAKLTLDNLAILSGIDRGNISRIELGRVSPNIETISHLSLALNLTLAQFFSLDDSAQNGTGLFQVTPKTATDKSFRSLSTALEQCPATVVITDLKGNIEYVNPRFTETSGYTMHEVMGQNPRFLKSGTFSAEAYEVLWNTIASGEVWRGEFHNRKKSGELYWEQASISPFRDTFGVVAGYVAVKEDVTARKLAEEEKSRLQAQLRQAQKLECLGSLAGGIAHDFNNILSAILGAAELMNLQLTADSPVRNSLDIIFQAGRRAQALNRQVQTFSRKGPEIKIPFDLSALIKETIRLLTATLPKNIHVKGVVKASLWVLGDPNQIHQVFMNLAINAFHAMGESGGDLTIDLKEIDASRPSRPLPWDFPLGLYAEISIRDSGCGMDSVVLEQIFDPFFTTKAAREGTGLGLSVVHGIVHKHEGRIQVSSAVGEGTQFLVFLPMTEARPSVLIPEEGAPPEGTEYVLLVDDEDFVAALIKQGLRDLGYQVTSKTSAFDALEAFRKNPTSFDILVTDLGMPNLSGTDLTERILKIRPGLPTILVTGKSMESDLGLWNSYIFDEVLQKPQTSTDIARAIRRVLESRRLRNSHQEIKSGNSAEPASDQSLRLKKILLVEDNPETRLMLRSMLVKEGFDVQEAVDGHEAWEIYLSAPDPNIFNLIMTDIKMPRMDGLELVNRIRQVNPRTPVVILSSSEDPVDLETARALQISEIINKPFDQKGLFDCVNYFLPGHASARRSLT